MHIADVSFYIEPGSALDSEAFERGNSVYLPGQVIPMLPEVLSNDICSLKPNRKRAAFSVFIDYDKKGKVTNCELADTVIKSKAKLSYEEVQDYFDNKPAPDKLNFFIIGIWTKEIIIIPINEMSKFILGRPLPLKYWIITSNNE